MKMPCLLVPLTIFRNYVDFEVIALVGEILLKTINHLTSHHTSMFQKPYFLLVRLDLSKTPMLKIMDSKSDPPEGSDNGVIYKCWFNSSLPI